jgi:hypothetical protein
VSVLAHGIGERGDLPLPLYLFSWGVGLALVLSFVALGALWTEPRLARASVGRALVHQGPAAVLHLLGRAAGLALYGLCLYAAFAGFDAPDRNILPVTLYVVVWVGGQVVGGLLGDVWAAVNPIDTLASGAEGLSRLLGRAPAVGPVTWGHWPAAVGLLVFLFYELSHPTGALPSTLGWLLAVHAGLTVILGFLWGAAWVVDHEPFSVFFSKIGAMAPVFDRRDEPGGTPSVGLRAPMSGLSTMEVKPGTVVLILVAIGGTSFDGFSESGLGRDLFGDYFGWRLAWAELGALIVSITLVSALYYAGVLWTSNMTGLRFDRAWQEFAPSLIPIAFGYAVAHYFQLLSDESQSFVFRLSDPLGRGWDLLGVADGLIWRIDPTIVAWVQVAAILVGHVGAVTVAHDRAVELFPAGKSMQSQLAMLFVMVAYSALGLWLLLTA